MGALIYQPDNFHYTIQYTKGQASLFQKNKNSRNFSILPLKTKDVK